MRSSTIVKNKRSKNDGYNAIFLIFLWMIFFPFSSLMALDPQKIVTQYRQDTWQRERGLEQKLVISICQTRDGYIWLGTLDGLVRFDGIRFKVFNKENTKELKSNMIKTLLEDQTGNLWIGTIEGGLSCLKNGEIKTYSLADYPGIKAISTIFQDRAGTLWIGTENDGLFLLKNGALTPTLYSARDGLKSNKVRAFYEDKGGDIWIGTSAGLSICNATCIPCKFTAYQGKNGPFDKHIISMCSTGSRDIWFGCEDGLYRLKDNTITHFGKELSDPTITCLYEDKEQNLWAGTDGSGLIRIRNDGIETFPPGHFLASDHVYAIYEDKEKNLWIGSSDEGLYRLSDTLFTAFTSMEGLSNDRVNCVYEDREGSLWIGTKNGVNRLENGKLTLEWTTGDGLLSNNITVIMKDSEGSLWIGTDKGLNQSKDGKLKHINLHNGVLDKKILQLWEDKKGVVWILTAERLIRFYKGTFTESFTLSISKNKGFNTLFRCFYIDRLGTLWLGTYDGGGLYGEKEGKTINYTTKEGLVQNDVEYFYEDKEGIFYIATRGGLSLLSNGKFINLTTQDGLIDSYIYFILEDELGHLWLPGRTGISRISKKELSDFIKGKIKKINPVLFNESDGMRSPFCNHCIKNRDGKLWFATDKGLAMINPSAIKKNEVSPLVAIEELVVDGEAFPISEPLIIPPGKKRLEFYFTGLSFVNSQQIKFKIKLEGYDSDWVDVGNARGTTYTSLSPKNYTFKVTACNSDGVWNEKGASLSFYLKPYFTQTYWFYVLLVLSVLSVGFIGYRLRVSQLKARQKELTALVNSRTQEIKEKNRQLEDQSIKLQEMDQIKSRFFANISHEFRTPLTLIMGPLEQMIAACRDNEQEEKRKLNMMLRNAQRLLRLINQLLELSKLDSGKMKLQAVKTGIITFLKGIIDSFGVLAHQNQLDLVLETGGAEEIFLYLDPRKMEDIMTNLLVNAFKFTPAGGRITVVLEQTGRENNQKLLWGVEGGDFLEKSPPLKQGHVEISVCDTGPGIPAGDLPYIFDRFYQAESTYEFHQKGTGIGLALAKELVELHHGTIEARSRQGEGCTFIIHLPLGRDHLAPGEIVELPPNHTKTQPATDDMTNNEISLGNHEPENGANESNIILVVEDSADMCDYIRGALEPVYTVVDAKDGREGIEKAREFIPDLIISDIMMPEVDGYELCRTLKNDVKTSHIPIILLTARAAEENIIQGLETGADDYITKPFNTNILMARIKNLIDIRRQLQKNINREMSLQPVKTSISSIDREFLKDLHEAIQKNLEDEDFNVEQLCKKLYMGRTTLYRKVLALTGETPTDFIRSYRLKQGAELLKQKSGTVLEVALAVGFSNSSYFAKCFKEKFHQLPSEYQTTGK